LGIPCKTAAGHAELVASERRLSQRHRTLLLLVDGRRSVDEVLQLGLQAGVPRAYLDELLALGLIVLAAPMTAAVQLDQDPFAATAAASAFASTPEVASVHEHDDDAMLDTVGLGPAISNTQLAQLDDTDLAFAQARSVLLHAFGIFHPCLFLEVCLVSEGGGICVRRLSGGFRAFFLCRRGCRTCCR